MRHWSGFLRNRGAIRYWIGTGASSRFKTEPTCWLHGRPKSSLISHSKPTPGFTDHCGLGHGDCGSCLPAVVGSGLQIFDKSGNQRQRPAHATLRRLAVCAVGASDAEWTTPIEELAQNLHVCMVSQRRGANRILSGPVRVGSLGFRRRKMRTWRRLFRMKSPSQTFRRDQIDSSGFWYHAAFRGTPSRENVKDPNSGWLTALLLPALPAIILLDRDRIGRRRAGLC